MSLRMIIAMRAKQLGLSGYDIARAIKTINNDTWLISCDHMEQFLQGRKDMTSAKVDAVLAYLKLLIVAPADFIEYRSTQPRGASNEN